MLSAGEGYIGHRAGAGKCAVRTVAPRMNHAFGDTLVIKVEDLLTQGKVFKERWPRRASPKRILVVRNHHTLGGGQPFRAVLRMLVNFSARTPGRDQVIQVR